MMNFETASLIFILSRIHNISSPYNIFKTEIFVKERVSTNRVFLRFVYLQHSKKYWKTVSFSPHIQCLSMEILFLYISLFNWLYICYVHRANRTENRTIHGAIISMYAKTIIIIIITAMII